MAACTIQKEQQLLQKSWILGIPPKYQNKNFLLETFPPGTNKGGAQKTGSAKPGPIATMQTRSWAVDGRTPGGLVPPCKLGSHTQSSPSKELFQDASPELRLEVRALLHLRQLQGGI